MSLKALQIVDEEFDRAAARMDPTRPQNTLDVLMTVEARIKERLMQECVEIPEGEFCCFCGETEDGCIGGGFDSEIQAHDFTPGGIPTKGAGAGAIDDEEFLNTEGANDRRRNGWPVDDIPF